MMERRFAWDTNWTLSQTRPTSFCHAFCRQRSFFDPETRLWIIVLLQPADTQDQIHAGIAAWVERQGNLQQLLGLCLSGLECSPVSVDSASRWLTCWMDRFRAAGLLPEFSPPAGAPVPYRFQPLNQRRPTSSVALVEKVARDDPTMVILEPAHWGTRSPSEHPSVAWIWGQVCAHLSASKSAVALVLSLPVPDDLAVISDLASKAEQLELTEGKPAIDTTGFEFVRWTLKLAAMASILSSAYVVAPLSTLALLVVTLQLFRDVHDPDYPVFAAVGYLVELGYLAGWLVRELHARLDTLRIRRYAASPWGESLWRFHLGGLLGGEKQISSHRPTSPIDRDSCVDRRAIAIVSVLELQPVRYRLVLWEPAPDDNYELLWMSRDITVQPAVPSRDSLHEALVQSFRCLKFRGHGLSADELGKLTRNDRVRWFVAYHGDPPRAVELTSVLRVGTVAGSEMWDALTKTFARALGSLLAIPAHARPAPASYPCPGPPRLSRTEIRFVLSVFSFRYFGCVAGLIALGALSYFGPNVAWANVLRVIVLWMTYFGVVRCVR